MTTNAKDELLEVKICGKTLRDWEAAWVQLVGGFKLKRPELRFHIGLVRALIDRQTMYVFRATEHANGGLEKGLQRIRGVEQSGNQGYGAQMLREHFDELSVDTLVVGNDASSVEPTKKLKVLMIKLHQPLWNKPHYRQLELMRTSKNL